MTKQVNLVKLGLVSYANGLKIQEHYVNQLKSNLTTGPHTATSNNLSPDGSNTATASQTATSSHAGTLLMLEHSPVYTIGIRSMAEYNEDLERKLNKLGADFYKTNRGGLITFHGPGQLVAYPILNLKHFTPSIKWFVQSIENTIIQLCKQEFGLNAGIIPKYTGVFINNQHKICAIGVHSSQYITHHGLAINCNTDLTWFGHITPCGLKDKGVTSLSAQCQRDVSVDEVVPMLKTHFEDVFECECNEVEVDKKIKHLVR